LEVLAFVIRDWEGSSPPGYVGMKYHSVRPLAAIGKYLKPLVVVPKEPDYVICLFWPKHKPGLSA